MVNSVELQEIIDNIAQKKHVVSDQALRAKEQVDRYQSADHDDLNEEPLSETDIEPNSQSNKTQVQAIENFNQSVKVLTDIFQQSQFDQLVLLAAQPARICILNFCIGVFKGIGFAVGVITIFYILAYSFRDTITYELLRQFLG
tara:strand:+ start:153 stop:584 length:432 start_codon:yes stop_codon:yes gene_type:complete